MENAQSSAEFLNPQESHVAQETPLRDSSPPDENTGPKTGYPRPGSEDD